MAGPILVATRTPTLGELIQTHWEKPTGDLVTIIARHHPAATTAEIIAELERQAAAALAEADALERHRDRRR
jgi:hypothetical protein